MIFLIICRIRSLDPDITDGLILKIYNEEEEHDLALEEFLERNLLSSANGDVTWDCLDEAEVNKVVTDKIKVSK